MPAHPPKLLCSCGAIQLGCYYSTAAYRCSPIVTAQLSSHKQVDTRPFNLTPWICQRRRSRGPGTQLELVGSKSRPNTRGHYYTLYELLSQMCMQNLGKTMQKKWTKNYAVHYFTCGKNGLDQRSFIFSFTNFKLGQAASKITSNQECDSTVRGQPQYFLVSIRHVT